MKDFDLTEEQRDIVKAVREFTDGEFELDRARECDQEHEFPLDLYEKATELGFIGIHFPEEYGGAGLGAFENMLVVEELCRADSTLGTATFIPKFGSEIILRFGNDEQKSEYLPRVLDGEPCCGMFTEPEHGSDLSSVDTKAEKENGEWVINGTKQFITNAEIADFGTVLCQTKTGAKHKGESFLLVDDLQDRDGVSINDVGTKFGIRSTSTGEVSFNDVRVSEENLIGGKNKGFYQAMEFFDESRIEVSAQALGIAECAFDKTIDYIQEREQFGQKLSKFEGIQFKIAEIATKIEAAKNLLYKAARNFDRGNIDPRLTCMAKWYCGQTAVEAADEAIQLHGGYGYIADYDVERIYRDAKITEIYEGTKEIQKYTIAREILGR
ncbi:acyl-CoA dehydrogenase [candidate division MSBL1 archaeon SCGC-AAA259I09]|uniref:Acyl-CoA dehydrogenase n=1 Tax=candidate division MSBL1 archaeon SCGC-AAA259I09 TaxID=1698267 RepID=A0A133UR77_9EURY|nr:acyl-CoA dehydrogenase [candidate division MSBL1 archaeon SCGC-AAA259I09]